ncbi:MAG: hypothetical protein LBI03_08410 [Clostridiales bacterium]|jgi:hypothetical protein|nr:hypothetical protein [Clostridiales bacterium]
METQVKQKRTAKYVPVLVWLAVIMTPLHSQVKQSHDVVAGFMQLKDGLNLGMVFNGAQMEYRYGVQWRLNTHEIQYQPRLGFGLGTSRFRTMECYHLHIAPVNITWTIPVYEQNGRSIRVGANFITDYNYQYWEDLHDAPLFWSSEIGLSPVVHFNCQWNNRRISAVLQNSLMGFTSHIQGYDTYFWQKTAGDFFVKPHTGLKFGSFNNYNHTRVSLGFVPNTLGRHSFLYEFDYAGFFYGNPFYQINHNLIWRISR